MLITFLAPVVASFALQFGPPEFFAVFFLTFCSFIGMGKEPKAKIVAAMAVGLLLAAVGMDTISGDLRMTFGSTELLRGFDFLVVVIGLFGISEILMTIEEGLAFKGKKASIDLKVVFRTWAQLPRYWLTMLRSALVGCWMGVTPGGAVAASFMGYGLAKKFSRDPDRDRKSTRLNSSHQIISYAVFCLKKKRHTDTLHAQEHVPARLLVDGKGTNERGVLRDTSRRPSSEGETMDRGLESFHNGRVGVDDYL